MPPSTQFLEVFERLMLEGLNITRQAQEGDAIYADNGHLSTTFTRYIIWKGGIKDFLTDIGRNTIEYHVFYEGDSVPHLYGGEEYGDIKSNKSQTLLKNIRLETSKKLDLLMVIGKSLFGERILKTKVPNSDIIVIPVWKGSFSFNVVTGGVILNTVKVYFPPDQQKFILLKTIVLGDGYQAFYPELCKALDFKFDKPKEVNRRIQLLLKEIKEDLKILPRKGSENADIFKNIPRKGFRLLVK